MEKRKEPLRLTSRALCVPSMGTVLKGLKSPVLKPNMIRKDDGNTSRGQGQTSDRLAEGRLCETHESMNKNLIKGRRDEVSWHNTAKPYGQVAEVNQAIVWGRTVFLPGEVSPVRAGEKSAEVIVTRDKPGAVMARLNSQPANWTR
jgi:hypothetical protein